MRKMLIVDDEESNLKYLTALFQRRGFSVQTATNGLEALEEARRDRPVIAISDVLMPVMDGFRLCREWRSDPRLKGIPFILLTGTFTNEKDEELALNLGADLFILKPKMSDELVTLVEGVLLKFEQASADVEKGTPRDAEVLEEYGEVLSRKLEEKVRELEEANRAIGESETKYRSFFENATEGLLRTTRNGRILMANPALCHMLGYDSFQDLMTQIADIATELYADPGDRTILLDQLDQSGTVPGFETRYRRKDGSIIWVSLDLRATLSTRGDLLYYEGIVKDVTDRRRGEDALLEERQKFLTLTENAPFGMLLIDRDGNFTYANEMFKEILGYELKDIPNGKEWFRRAYPEAEYRHATIAAWIDDLRKADIDRKRSRVYAVKCKNGDTKTIRFVPVQLPTGETILSCEDITQQMQIQHAIEESRTTLRSLIDATTETLLMIDRSGTVLVANQMVARRLGTDITRLVGSCLYDYLPPETAARRKTEFDRVFTTGTPVNFSDDREGRVYDIYAYPVFGDTARVEKVVVFASDITERREAERQGRLNESRLQSLYDIYQYGARHIHDILDYSLEKCIAITGSRIGYIYFYDEETKVFTLNSWSKEVHKECTIEGPKIKYDLENTGIWGEAVRQRKPIIINDFQAPHPWKKGYPEGHAALYRFLTIPVIVENRIVLVVGVANKGMDYDQSDVRQLTLLMDSVWNIISQREAEKALRESEMKYRNIFENASEGIFQITTEGRFISVNPAFARMAGYGAPEEMVQDVNTTGKFYLRPEERAAFAKQLKNDGYVSDFVVLHGRKDGGTFWGSINARAIHNIDTGVVYYEGTIKDITENRLAEERLRDVLFQLEEKNVELLQAYEELKESQKKTIQSEKMASIGQLAAGVAHEINNPTGFVISNLNSLRKYTARLRDFCEIQERALRELSEADDTRRAAILERTESSRQDLKIGYILEDIGNLIEESLDGADRVKKIVQDLKSFSRVDDTAFAMADIHSVLETTLNIVWNELKYKGELRKDYGEIPRTRCNPGQLSQVFMNLLVNAAHSIAQYGEIRIKTWHDGQDVFVSISDTGCGISDENKKRLFEPFFTTKEAGKGTGLGLSIACDIMTKHNGEITVASEVGKGTTMTVRIPIQEVGDVSGNNDIAGRR